MSNNRLIRASEWTGAFEKGTELQESELEDEKETLRPDYWRLYIPFFMYFLFFSGVRSPSDFDVSTSHCMFIHQ